MNFIGYRCSLCGAEYAPADVDYVCPRHGAAGTLEVVLDYAALRKTTSPAAVTASSDRSLWRYLPLLPVADPGFPGTVLRSVGWTPFFRADRLAADLGLRALFIKDDSRNPTASFKDRASAVVVARAREIKAPVIAAASTGNAGAALAGLAGAGQPPGGVRGAQAGPEGQSRQAVQVGGPFVVLPGKYGGPFDLTLQASQA